MSSDQYQRVKEVFLAVYQRPEAEQDAAAAEMCGSNQELQEEVRALLNSHRRALRQGSGEAVVYQATQLLEAAPPKSKVPQSGGMPSSSGMSLSQSPMQSRSRPGSSSSSHVSRSGTWTSVKSRFAPGTVLCERYRVVSLIGEGGMGEVYRADDLTLDQPVALKFLPQTFQSDPSWMERFHNEVRMSRQIAHPNVCRVFDIGEVSGAQFITMEFVDGEDLSSLVRRIGRLPRDKAIQIARQICAGLSAAHECGVLHRDLKPANVMLDGRGNVRITDFGVSTPTNGKPDVAAGTPAYMAPEIFSRGQATVRSDVYSLGLLLYELFSGRPAFTANSMPEYARVHRDTVPPHPSSFIDDMDPLVERVILRCLEKEPTKRPPNALAVAAALPGGDPLAAVLAAGETPSPEMVAAAGSDASMAASKAAALLAITLLGLLTAVVLSRSAWLLPRVPMEGPQVLAEKSRQVLAAATYATLPQPATSAQGYTVDDYFAAYIQKTDKTPGRWNALSAYRSPAALYWYRESPGYMVSKDDTTMGMVVLDAPPTDGPGMRTVILDTQGRLRKLTVQPTEVPNFSQSTTQPSDSPPPAADFSPLFDLAEFNRADFQSIPSTDWDAPVFADALFTWRGHYPDAPDKSVQIDAASFHGRPVFFQVIDSWQTKDNLAGLNPVNDLHMGNVALQAGLILLALVSGVLIAWHNVRSGRGDFSGAQKVAGLFLGLGILDWLLVANHVPDVYLEIHLFLRILGYILVPAMASWLFYLALEPYVRRISPQTVISWSRLLAGRFTDPLVSSDILTGLAVAMAATIVAQLGNLLPMWFGGAATITRMINIMRMMAKDSPSAVALRAMLEATYMAMLYLLTLVLLQLVIRRRWAVWTAFLALVTVATVQWNDADWPQWLETAVATGLTLLLLVQFGLVATLSGLWAIYLMRNAPITSDMSVWYADQSRFAIGLIALIAIAAATVASGGWSPRRSLQLQPAAP